MNQRLYGIWLGDVLFCFSGEISESKVDTWTASIRAIELTEGIRPFQQAALRLAEVRCPVSSARRAARSGERKGLIGRTLEGLALPAPEAWSLLLHWDESLLVKQGIIPGVEMNYWSVVSQFALELMLQGKITPGMRPVARIGGRRRGAQSSLRAAWGPLLSNEEDDEKFRQLAGAMPPICLSAVQLVAAQEESSLEQMQISILYSFLTAIIDNETRKSVGDLGRKLNPSKADYRRGYSPLHELWWNSLLSSGQPPDIQGSLVEISQLAEDISAAGGDQPQVTDDEQDGRGVGTFRLCLRLEPAENIDGHLLNRQEGVPEWVLTFWAEGVEDPALLLPAGFIWSYPEREMEVRERIYKDIQENLLLRLKKASELSAEVSIAMESQRPEGATLGPEEVYTFLSRSVPLLRKNGVAVQMPSRWTKEGRRQAGVKIKADGWDSENEDAGLPKFGVDQLVSFQAEAVINGHELTQEELVLLSNSKSPLVFFRGEWIEIDVKEIKQVLKFMKRHEQGTMTFRELMYLTSDNEDDNRLDGMYVERVESTGLLSMLMDGEAIRRPEYKQVPASLQGTLRPYQERGYQWLSTMRKLGFGALLADDMGLGKTVQVITVLLDGLAEGAGKSLIICPTSLLGNWERELTRFAPELRLYVHHGSDRLHGDRFLEACENRDVVLTTYQLAGRDAKELRDVKWDTIVLDEAQYIKNFGTKQAQSVMKLAAPHRIAMTGTPVENRLSELWSIFQFLNPGYLGSHASFRSRYTGTGGNQSAELGKLRKLVAPFLLRRLKSDPDIRKDLPEKIELKSYCTLTPEQARMYQTVTEELMSQIGTRDGIARKGLVLTSLTRLKQICDHPLLAVGRTNAGDIADRSGKMERLTELLDLIMDNGEASLIFTQYVHMGELLKERLAQRYGVAPFFLHGGVLKSERDQMVQAFQEGIGSPLFVLSLKAGGVGLNLTRANHVVHYDRWWNPAVENQATDRVFRIGQNKNVEVHKLICQGTLEERIDELIERKKSLSEQVVGSGEQWLTEMSNEELRNLVALQAGSIGEEDGR
ncbi:DEAD/DEAH box helicase [Paenibacillus anaericanus]|uniref:DEAD/DEAH box helicase n=1 Tax=Paenibacillus anaericanus TaxID=170367 RepID=A0A433YF16_9BACL|nr:DEAD/DEAH box helicase [Paenibacillus anaericanus]RUT48457.1 DEAD/DEAH box helicase [Paenibacillus anaericanus]